MIVPQAGGVIQKDTKRAIKMSPVRIPNSGGMSIIVPGVGSGSVVRKMLLSNKGNPGLRISRNRRVLRKMF